VRGEQLIAVDVFLRAASQAMEAMRKELLAAKLAVPPIPDIAPFIPAFQVYADRARRALAAAGLKEAL
jgi:ribosomal protein S11